MVHEDEASLRIYPSVLFGRRGLGGSIQCDPGWGRSTGVRNGHACANSAPIG